VGGHWPRGLLRQQERPEDLDLLHRAASRLIHRVGVPNDEGRHTATVFLREQELSCILSPLASVEGCTDG
jgi:hypothetical protein